VRRIRIDGAPFSSYFFSFSFSFFFCLLNYRQRGGLSDKCARERERMMTILCYVSVRFPAVQFMSMIAAQIERGRCRQ
jgi:hypothetical protein